MNGIGVGLLELQNECLRLCTTFDRLNPGQKAAFFDDQFMVDRR
jgi:hypothetical protein